jgi:hypothetical protein
MPREHTRRRQLGNQRAGILASFVAAAAGAAASNSALGEGRSCVDRSPRVAVLDVVPFLLTVLSPQVQSNAEHSLLSRPRLYKPTGFSLEAALLSRTTTVTAA